MTNTKTTKRALLASILSLFLCVSMLLGTTFAWFTDEATNIGNKIIAGNLDVDLLMYKDRDYKSIANEVGSIFSLENDGYWEPGKTEIVYLAVKNNGNLALKYNIMLEIAGELAPALEYVIVKGKQKDLADKADNWTELLTIAATDATTVPTGVVVAAPNGKLLANDDLATTNTDNDIDYFALAVHMKEEADSTYEDKEIEIDVKVVATQVENEEDYFGTEYDKDVVYYEALATTTEELNAALEAGKKVIGIKGTAVELAAERAGKNRDMNDVTIVGVSDDATLTITGTGGGLDNINLKNIKVVDSTFYTSEDGENAWEFTYLELGGVSTFVNVAFEDGIMSDGPMSTFVGCTFSGHNNDSSTHGATTMYGAWVYNGKATFTDCYFSGTRGLKVCDQYAGEVSSVVVDACVFGPLSEKPGLAIDDREESSFNIVIKNSYFIDCQAGDQSAYIYETDNYVPVLENNTIVANGTVVATAEALNAVTNGENVFLATDIDIVNTDANNQMFIEATGELNFNGIGNTISVSGSNPSEGNHNYVSFLPPAGASAKVENVTVTGEGFVEVGDYFQGGGSYTVNNVTVKDLVSTLANGDKGFTLACGFCHYGNAELNDCNMTGTTAMIDGAMAVDAGFVNGTTTLVNGGVYGKIYCWSHAVVTFDDDAKVDTLYVSPIKGTVTIKADTHVRTINIDYGTSASNVTQARLQKLVIENGAIVDEIVYAGNTYTVDTWNSFVTNFGA